MKTRGILLSAALGTLSFKADAQLPIPGTHYPVGLEGIKGAAMPAPGLNVRDDNYIYLSTYEAQPSFQLTEYVQAPSLMWTSDWNLFGIHYSCDAMVPIVFKRINNSALTSYTFPGALFPIVVSQNAHHWGIGDIKIEPVLLSWRWKQLDVTAGYALWLPTGDYNQTSLDNSGNNTYTHMASLGFVWYPDHDKTWSFSILNHYEFNSRQVGYTTSVGITPGGGFPAVFHTYQNLRSSVYSMEWGVSKSLNDVVDLGIIGYYQKQYTAAAPGYLTVMFQDSEVCGIGPEFDLHFTRWNLSTKFRYAYEFTDYHHPDGSTIDLEISKGF